MASSTHGSPRRLRRAAAASLAAAGLVALSAGAASSAPAPTPKPCTPKQSVWAKVTTDLPVAVTAGEGGAYTIEAEGVVSGYAARSVDSVTVFLDGAYVGRATLAAASKASYTVPAEDRSWSLDVPATKGSHQLLVCSNSTYSSLAGTATTVLVPNPLAGPQPV